MSDDLTCTGCGEYVGSPIAARIEALTAERDALIAAALKEAADASKAAGERAKSCPPDCKCSDPWHIASRILALTPADAIAAHERAIKDAVQAERERCAKVADGHYWPDMDEANDPTARGNNSAARGIAAAIRAGGAQ